MKRTTIIFLLLFALLLIGCADDAEPTDTTTAVTTVQAVQLSGEEFLKFEFFYPLQGETVTAQSNDELFDAFAQLMASYPSYDTMELTVQMRGVIADQKKFESISYKTINEWNSDRDPYVHAELTLKYDNFDVDAWLNLAADEEVTSIKVTIPYKFEVVDD